MRWSINDGYLEALRGAGSSTAEIRAGFHVAKVLFEGQRAVGVQLVEVATGLTSHEMAETEVIVCCGAVQSPALLQANAQAIRAQLYFQGDLCG